MIIAFTSPVHGQTCTTSNMESSVTMMALETQFRTLITHTHLERSTLERSFQKLIATDIYQERSGGMDGVDRLVSCDMLEPSSIKDNAVQVIKDHLDILAGLTTNNKESLKRSLNFILSQYKRSYDLLFIDVSSGTQNELSRLVLERADLVVMNLNQNHAVLDSFFNDKEWENVLQGKEVLYCLGSYKHNSKLSKEKIAKDYHIPLKKIGVIPYNIKYMDAQNDKHIIDFLLRARNVQKKFLTHDEEVFFIESVRHMGSLMLKALEMHPLVEADMYD